jgi:hypothetical protein
MIAGLALLLVLLPFLFWYGTWFGRKLTPSQIGEYLHDAAKPRHAQHALVQIGERLARRDPEVKRWYPRIVELSRDPHVEIRQTTAWIMGQDHAYAPFHAALLELLRDPQPMVRRNAALSLSNFGDAAARPELLAMLRPYTVVAPAAGPVRYRLHAAEFVNPGTLVGRVGDTEVRSPLPGEVRALDRAEGAQVRAGDALVELGPDKDHVWEALRALYSIGQREDLAEVQRYEREIPNMPDRIRRQASLTARAIAAR